MARHLLRRAIARILDGILARPGPVTAVSGALAVVAVLLGLGVELRTSRSELAPPGDPEQERFDRLMAQFDGRSALVALVEAAGPANASAGELRKAADALAAAFRGAPGVQRVFHRIDLDWFLRHALHLAPPDQVQHAVAVASEAKLPALATSVHNLAAANAALADRLQDSLAGGDSLPDAAERAAAARGLEALATLLAAERRFLSDTEAFLADLEASPPLLALAGNRGLGSDGYLSSRDGSLLFILVTPSGDDDSLPALRSLLAEMRRRADQITAQRPAVRVVFTGEPATTVEEMDTVRRDTVFTAALAMAGVTLLTLLVFRWRSHALLVLAALSAGVIWSFGAVRLELGYLNMITSAFISTLIGVGVAYGIHPVSEYELEGAHLRDPLRALQAAFHHTGTAVTVSAVTTAGAFFSILFMDFRGFAELGLVAGVGVLLCLLAFLVTLPALLALYGAWRHRGLRRRRGDQPSPAETRRAAVDRLWMERGSQWAGRFPRTVTIAALLVTAALGWAATGVRFNTNMLDLLPSGAESLEAQRRMILESDLSPLFNVATAGDLEQLRSMQERAAAEPTIRRLDSALPLLPVEPDRSRAAAQAAGELLRQVHLPETLQPLEPAALAASLDRLEGTLADAADMVFSAGLGELAGPLENARAEAEAARDVVRHAPAERAAEWSAGQQRLRDWAARLVDDLRTAAGAELPGADDLPPTLKARYRTQDGRWIAYLYPAGDIFDPEFRDAYIAACRRLDPEATGFPVVFRHMADRITGGFNRAVAAGAVLVVLILLVDTRSVRDTLLAVLPLGMGIVWMLGGMRLLGLSYNFANLVAVPLIIGVGIDNGVHVIHRLRLEGEQGITVVMRHTSRAILIASLTTMIGFGSLALASHRGLASLGSVLLLGVGACLATSIVVLPNILLALGLVRR